MLILAIAGTVEVLLCVARVYVTKGAKYVLYWVNKNIIYTAESVCHSIFVRTHTVFNFVILLNTLAEL